MWDNPEENERVHCVSQQNKAKSNYVHIDGLVQERRNSIAKALELRLFALTHHVLFSWRWDIIVNEPHGSIHDKSTGLQ